MAGFLTSDSVSLANGSDVVHVTGSVDCSHVYSGTAVFIDGELFEGLSGTEPDGSGNSTITLRYTYSGTSISGAGMIVFNTIEGLRDAIDRAGEIIEQYETHLLTVVDIVRGGTGATTVEGMRSAFSLYSKAEVDNAIAAMEPDPVLSLAKGGTGATTAAGARLNLGLGTSSLLAAGASNGTATLDVNGKVPLTQINDSLLGQVEYKGLWDPSNNTPTLPTTPVEKGHYYICSTTGAQFGITFATGDWIISSGTSWDKVDNTDAVSSVQGRTGNVVLTADDVDAYTKGESDSRYLTSGSGLLSPFGLIPLNGGVWASGQTFTAYNQYMIFDGEAYSPLPATTLPYTVGATPDSGFVYQIQLNDHSKLANRNASGAHDASAIDFTDYTAQRARMNSYTAGETTISGATLRDTFVTARTLNGLTDCHAFADRTIISNAADSGTYGTFDSTTEVAGSHTQSHQFSFQNRAKFSGSGRIDTWGGYISWPTLTNATSTVGEMFHFEAKDVDTLGRFDAITNQFGIKVFNQSKGVSGNYAFWTTQAWNGTTGYSFYSSGTGKMLQAGEAIFSKPVIFGASVPVSDVPLSWTGGVGKQKGFLSSSTTGVQWGVSGDYTNTWVANGAERLILENSAENYALRPASSTQNLGTASRPFNEVKAKMLVMTPIASASVTNLSFFVDSADGKAKFKDASGVVNALY